MRVPTPEELNLVVTLPAVGLALWACALLALDLLIPRGRKEWTALLALGGLAVAFVFNLSLFDVEGRRQAAFNGMYLADGYAAFVNLVALLAAFFGVLVAHEYLKRTGIERGEFYPLLLISASGTMLMGAAGDLVIVFVALEMLSIPLYILAGLRRPQPESEESALKYFLLGAFSSAFLVYGISLIYGATGTTNLGGVVAAIADNALADSYLLLIGAALMLVGLGFKVAAVPFHMWTPDVYQGAPTAVTAYMSVGAKVGGFAGLMRVFVTAFPAIAGSGGPTGWQDAMAIIAALTMILGNVIALAQRDIKRMLAYSSIAHAGYVLMGVATAGTPSVTDFGVSAALFYLLAYAFTNLGAFAVAIAVERDDGGGTLIDDFAGLSKTRPALALAMALFMLSLTGIPPSAGMVGKFFLFQAAVDADLSWLALVGLVTSVVSAFYYVRVVVRVYLQEGPGLATPARPYLGMAVLLTAIGTFVLGVVPMGLLDLARGAVFLAFGG